jgi:hypothetical protein
MRYRGGFDNIRMLQQGIFHLYWTDVVARSDDHVVVAAQHLPTSVLVTDREVFCQKDLAAPPLCPQCRGVLVCARHLVPGSPHGDQSGLSRVDRITVAVRQEHIETRYGRRDRRRMRCGSRLVGIAQQHADL